jgi:putative transposase
VHREGPVRQKGGAGEAEATGANPTDRGKPGTKRHLLTEGKGVPVAVVVTGANRHDRTKLADLLDATVVEPAPTEPPHLVLDRGYDYEVCRDEALARGLTPHIPPKASAERPLPPPGDPARHPPRRWVVEVGHSWFNRFRRLLVRWENRGAHDLGFVHLAACLIIHRKVRHARALSG